MDLRLARALLKKKVSQFVKVAMLIATTLSIIPTVYSIRVLDLSSPVMIALGIIIWVLVYSGSMEINERILHNEIFRD